MHKYEQFGWYISDIKIKTQKDVRLWLGANDRSEEGHYRWTSDNSTVEFTDWHPGEPTNVRTQNCVVKLTKAGWIDNADDTYTWDDDNCSTHWNYMCEK